MILTFSFFLTYNRERKNSVRFRYLSALPVIKIICQVQTVQRGIWTQSLLALRTFVGPSSLVLKSDVSDETPQALHPVGVWS